MRRWLVLMMMMAEASVWCFVVVPERYHHESLVRCSSSGVEGEEKRGVRLNKCLPLLSRRAADAAILEGRVSVDGEKRLDPGYRCLEGQRVLLDGKWQAWMQLEEAKQRPPRAADFSYLKYWKPLGVTCTTDRKVPENVIDQGNFHFEDRRVFPVGRLDKDSTGLLLLTSDGRLSEALLRPVSRKQKVYEVELNKAPTDEDLQALREGVVVTTVAQRGKRPVTTDFNDLFDDDLDEKDVKPTFRRRRIPLTAKTRPCQVERTEWSPRNLVVSIEEGRNRQIRRMCEARGLTVPALHRTEFAGLTLRGLHQPGDSMPLDNDELDLMNQALFSYAESNNKSPS